ncbi:MAG TPA: DUF427 domain-containing protein [Nocardioidaceae bacterium]|nr:DUF427 domain-containing protein [Nocardioidaceae bacterium]
MKRPTPDEPGPGQESVWDYPRPPRLERTSVWIEVVLAGMRIARTNQALRVLETSHPPTYYLPRSAFAAGSLRPTRGRSLCEWKGAASYFDVVACTTVAERVAWHYPNPRRKFADLVDHIAIYPAAMERCTVDDEVVVAQPGGFYGGWVTSTVVGPFKGVPGSLLW